jgi:hypothetical protein
VSDILERLDHTAEDLDVYDDDLLPEPEQGAAEEERARWEACSQERRARSELYPRSGLVQAAPIHPPERQTHKNAPAPLTRPGA